MSGRKKSAWERMQEMKAAGTLPQPVAKPVAARANPSRRMVVVNDNDEPGAVIHTTRCIIVNRWWPKYVRDATPEELANITDICGHCINQGGAAPLV